MDFINEILKGAPPMMKRIWEPRHRHVLATPLVDVVAVNVHSLRGGLKNLAIYGHIRVINSRLGGGDAKAFTLFDRDENNPHSMLTSQSLPLLTCSSPILPSEYTQLDVCLFDRNAANNNTVVAKGEFVLDKTSCDKFEQELVEEAFGDDDAFARVQYRVLQYGVAATVDVLFLSKDDDDKFDLLTKEKDTKNNSVVVADVFGSVSAFYNVTKEKRGRSISLFSESCEKAVRVKSGDFIPLSRSLVIVPAYSSSFAVEVNLSLGNTGESLASGILECTPRNEWTYDKDLDGGGEHGRVRVRVTWTHAYDQQFYHEKKQEYHDVKRRRNSDYVEVFSVAVDSKDSTTTRDDFSFYGRVEVEDAAGLCIYNKDESSPQTGTGALGALKGPHSRSYRSGDWFEISVHLKDATTGAELSNGQAVWDNLMISKWNERRLCSVIPGEVGFAAVHYTPFCTDSCWPYRVNVKLDGEQLQLPGGGGGYVYGKIVARYSTYEYSRAYDKKYFENILFDSEEADGALGCGSDVPLLKSVVVWPDDSNLVIEVDLAVASHPSLDDGSVPALLKGIVELTHKQPHQQLNAKTFHMDVSMSMLPWEAAYDHLY